MRDIAMLRPSLSDLPVEQLSTGSIEAALEERGIEIHSLAREFRKEATRWASAADPPPKPVQITTLFIGVGGTGQRIADDLRKTVALCRNATWRMPLLWIDDALLCDGLRARKQNGASTQQLARYLHLSIDAIAQLVDHAAAEPDSRFDTFWSCLTMVSRLPREIGDDPVLIDRFSASFLDSALTASQSRARCSFTWALDALVRGEPANARAGSLILRQLPQTVAGDTAAVLSMLLELRPAARESMPHGNVLRVPPTAVAAWNSFTRHAHAAAGEAAVNIRRRAPRHLSASDVLVPRFNDLLDALRDDVPLHGIFGMGSTKLALRLVGETLRQLPGDVRETLIAGMCNLLFEGIGRPDGRSAFLTLEAMEGLRESLPAECDKIMPSLANRVSDAACGEQHITVLSTGAATTHPNGEFESEAFWQQAAEACLIYATKRIRTRAWRCVEGSLPAGAKDAQDYVSEAMVLILRGERHRPATVSPIRFVLLVVRTLIDRDWTERENGTPHEFVDVLRAPHHASALRPLAFIDDAEIEAKLVARDCVEHFKAAVPEKCRTYVELLASDEVPSRRECARALGVHEKEIRSMDRVIRRLRPLWQGAPPRRSHSTVIPAKP